MIDKKFEENEHSLEMHIPYIKKVFQDRPIRFVPLMIGQIEKGKSMEQYGRILAPYFLDERTIFIVSTDFCHWGKRFKFTHRFPEESANPICESIRKLDKMGMDYIEKHDLTGF